MRKPEIMSPAGYWPQLRAAIEAGADAVYFGLKHFTARAKVGFDLEELPEVMRTLHARGVRGYVTFNTLVFEHELREAARTIAALARAGADALIIQDPSVFVLARRIAPAIELHASTQMSITDAEGVSSRGASAPIASRSRANFRSTKSRDPRPDRIANSRCSCMARCAWPIRAMLFLGSLGRPQRQSRPVRAGLPPALRPDGGWRT